MNKELKSIMLYHRSYRTFSGSAKSFFFQLLFISVPFSLLTVFFYPDITGEICRITMNILSPLLFADSIIIFEMPFIEFIGDISFLYVPGSFPPFYLTLINVAVGLILLIFLPQVERAKPLVIFLIVLSFIHVAASFYFLFFPAQFPYEAVDYSSLYMLQEVVIWFFVPIIMGFAILPLPASLISKIFVMIISYVYSIAFGLVRYCVFLFILAKISMLYMAGLFFLFGPLIDFIYVVGIYSLYANRVANNLKGDFVIWKWQ